MTSSTKHQGDPNRYVGDRLLAEGWAARQLPPPGSPGSRWTLTDRGRRIRLTMGYDLDGRYAEITAACLPGAAHTDPLWKLTISAARPDVLLSAARLAAAGCDADESRAARRRVSGALRVSGFATTAARIAVWAGADATWTSRDQRTAVTFTAPSRRGSGGWEIACGGSYAESSATTPPEIILALAGV